MLTVSQQDPQSNSSLQYPITLLDFQSMFPDELSCLAYLEKICWPNGFTCEKCITKGEPFRLSAYHRKLNYHLESVTADTVMHRSKTSIHVWYWAAYLVSTQTPGISALELQKKLGIKRYETAFQILHKLRDVMVRPDRDKIGSEFKRI